MSSLHNDIYDNGLSQLSSLTEKLYILKADPGVVWANIAAHAVGVKNAPAPGAPGPKAGGGREVVVPQITDGSVTGTDDALFFALTDDSASKILVSGPLAAGQLVTSGNTFTLTTFKVGIPAPA
jgi:hypothetical protein